MVEGGVSLGVAHRDRDDKRNSDHRRQVVGEPHFVADRLKPQGDGLGRPSEYRGGDCKWQSDTRSADSSWEQLGFHYAIYRRIASGDEPGRRDQKDRQARALYGL